MPSFEYQQVFEKVVEKLDAPDALKPLVTNKSVSDISEQQCQEAIKGNVPYYQPPVDTRYRKWNLIDPSYRLLSPIKLFLLFIQPFLNLLLQETNIAAKRDSTRKYA
jgi:hypothetical protein